MAKVLGIGGVFFKSQDPKKLSAWYKKWLNISFDEQSNSTAFKPADLPPGSVGVWCPFPSDTTYFQPSANDFMFNLVVDDRDGALEQVKEGGAKLAGKPEDYSYGKFGWFIDPEGNKVELWEPIDSGEL